MATSNAWRLFGASNSEAAKRTTANGQWRARGTKVGYTCANLLRWAFIAALFIFLLTMAIALSEVMSFQNRVVSLVGDADRARSAVLVLHRIQQNPDAYPEDESLPFAAIAVFLDRVRSAQERLGRFREITVVKPANGENGAEVEEESVEERYAGERARLNDSLNQLSRVLFQVEPQIVVARELQSVKDAVAGLQRFEMAPAGAAPDATALAAAREPIKQAGARLAAVTGLDGSDEFQQLRGSTAALEQLLDSADGGQLSKVIEQVRGDVSTLRAALEGSDPGDEATTRLEDALSQLEVGLGEVERAASSGATSAGEDEDVNTGEDGQNESPAEQMVEGVDELGTSLANLQKAIEIDVRNAKLAEQISALQSSVEGLFELRLKISELSGDGGGAITRGANGGTPEDRNLADYKTALGNIGDVQINLDRKLINRFGTDYTVAKELANGINTMSEDADVFGELKPGSYTALNGEVVDAKAATEAYQQALADLNQGFAELERGLGDRTRVVAVGNVIRSGAEESEQQANAKARAILHDFYALDRLTPVLQPFSSLAPEGSTLAQFGLHPQRLATLSSVSITTIYIFMIGAIGSLLYIAKYFIGQALRGRPLSERPDRPFSWLLFRPFFGVVVAFAVYLVVRAGELAIGTNGGDNFGTELNIPIISVVALFAGLLSWQALAAIESRGEAWFGSRTREPLWATGLGNALRNDNRTVGACAAQVGRSPEQVERWLMNVDRVTVEMQDRLTTWLKRPIAELFTDEKPRDQVGGEMLWATGLRLAMESGERRLDAKGLAELLHEEDERRVRKWMNLELRVSPAMQWKLVDSLGVPHFRLFDAHLDRQPAWAVGLREAMEASHLTARLLQERIEPGGVARVQAWRELDSAVPTDLQDDLVEVLDVPHAKLFHLGNLPPDFLLWAHDLDKILEEENRTRADLVAEMDVEPERVTAWIDRTKPVAPATRKRIADFLGRREDDIFKTHQGHLAPPAAPAGGENLSGDAGSSNAGGGSGGR